MDEFDEFSEHREARLPGQQLGELVRENRVVILYGLMLIMVMFSRGLWGPDERFAADLTQNLLVRGQWLPPASGMSYSSGLSPLYLWLAKLPAMVVGADGGVSTPVYLPWLMRIPSVLSSVLFLFYFRRWASRFFQSDVADLAMLILCSTPLWFWQSQAIQVDLLFTAMLGWSWLCWLAGYLLLRHEAEGDQEEHKRWFRRSYLWLCCTFLVKGSQALLLSALLLVIFLLWQKDWKAVKESLLNPGLVVLLFIAILSYFFGFVAVPNLYLLLRGLSQVQPLWIYAEYLVRDSFPWVLLLPALIIFLRGSGAHKSPMARFLMIAFLVPFPMSIWADGTRGTDPLVAYPFLALLLAGLLQPVYVEGVGVARIRRIGAILAAALWLAASAFFAVSVLRLGSLEVQGLVAPMLGPLRLAALVLAMGALSVSVRGAAGEGEFLVRETTATVCVVLLIIGTWGFHRLDPGRRTPQPMGGQNLLQGSK